MKKIMTWLLFFLLMNSVPVHAYDLATEISNNNGKVILSSVGYAKLGLIRLRARSKGIIHLQGTLSVKGTANIIMWAKVDGRYYFSKLPHLQNIRDQKNVKFKIPFNAAEKTITEVILEVELPGGGQVEINNIYLATG